MIVKLVKVVTEYREAMQWDGTMVRAEEIGEWSNGLVYVHPNMDRPRLVYDYDDFAVGYPYDWVVNTGEGEYYFRSTDDLRRDGWLMMVMPI